MITFIIPAYQAEATLRRTVDSIIRQTSNQWKIILVNDGSTDDTEHICVEYRDRYPNKIRYLCQENGGLGKARNIGIELVDTEYMSFLDSDDWLMPNFVEVVFNNYQKEKTDIILTLPIIYHEGSKIVRDWYDKPVFEKLFPEDGSIIEPVKSPLCYQMEVNACRKILNTEFVERFHFRFPEGIKWEDVYPHFYLLSKCQSCMGIKSVGFYYRVGSANQITASRGRERLDILRIYDELITYVVDEGKEELKFPVMRILVRFSIWSIRMTDGKVRRELIEKLTAFYKIVPKSFYSDLRKKIRKEYSKADVIQYLMFLFAIRSKVIHWIFFDYFYEDVATKIIKKILRAKERVA